MSLHQRLGALTPDRLRAMKRGLEKESLRATTGCELALTPHPAALGSALKHPHITTDFCESQLEFITGTHGDAQSCLDELTRIHQVAVRALADDEVLWVSSMPCVLPADETIPIGNYGTSNIGRAKSVYRMGLGHRYGRRMQTISGIHYNWSLPGVDTDAYLGLIRNFRRHSFVLLRLLGASPAVCASFVEGRAHNLQRLGSGSLHLPHATSLRMGRLGYQSDAQATLAISYNSLAAYGATLEDAMTRPYPVYEQLGVRNPGGEYNQLATTLLQIENEFYGLIRPKRVIRSGERPLHALRERGVEYVEVRCIDLDPFVPVGIAAATMRLLDLFLLHCLLSDSPPDTPHEIAALGRNQHRSAERGREAGLQLEREGRLVTLEDWAGELLGELQPLAQRLDGVFGGESYQQAWQQALGVLHEPQRSPSARVLATMRTEFDGSHCSFVQASSRHARRAIAELPYPDTLDAWARQTARASVEAQRQIEASDTLPFEEFRRRYLAPEQLRPREQAA